MNLDFPFHFDARGRTAAAPTEEYIRDLIIQYFFTAPGERVNRPDFGGGLRRRVFAPNSLTDAATLQFTARAGLQDWLGALAEIRNLEVTAVEATLTVCVQYTRRHSDQLVTERVSQPLPTAP